METGKLPASTHYACREIAEKLAAAEASAEDARDALRHIISTVNKSRTQTRRLHWISVRAQDGLDGTTNHQRVDLPKSAPTDNEKLRMKVVQQKKDYEAKIAELKKALEPFAREAAEWGNQARDDDFVRVCGQLDEDPVDSEVTVGDLRRAAALLEKK